MAGTVNMMWQEVHNVSKYCILAVLRYTKTEPSRCSFTTNLSAKMFKCQEAVAICTSSVPRQVSQCAWTSKTRVHEMSLYSHHTDTRYRSLDSIRPILQKVPITNSKPSVLLHRNNIKNQHIWRQEPTWHEYSAIHLKALNQISELKSKSRSYTFLQKV